MKNVISNSEGGILVDFDAKKFPIGMIAPAKKEDLAKTMGEKCKEWVIKNRSYEQMGKKVEAIYSQLLT
ncbi:hypothetical protein LCGC14_0965220 [marine sediment metagenome]|uniref:Glycosyl transferase family 1 domain-containing protein n=1 Tax=marine sediment metagenome TaxID=412755 RepID=A0A0F9NZE9_9ZZZZ